MDSCIPKEEEEEMPMLYRGGQHKKTTYLHSSPNCTKNK
jgi:hypothetical protein